MQLSEDTRLQFAANFEELISQTILEMGGDDEDVRDIFNQLANQDPEDTKDWGQRADWEAQVYRQADEEDGEGPFDGTTI